jgi:hypothetical protein
MPKIITNPLRAGLPSKIYYLAYSGPITGYEISKKIYGVKPHGIPPTAKTYEWIKKLKEQRILSKAEVGCVSNVEPLLHEIELTLKKKDSSDFSSFEKHMTQKILDCKEFRALVGLYFESFPKDQDFDAALEILDILSFQAMRVFSYDVPKSKANTQKQFDELFDRAITLIYKPEFQKELQEVGVEYLKDVKDPEELSKKRKKISEMRNNPFLNIDYLGIFLAVPQRTLEKLCKLNRYYDFIAYLIDRPLDFLTVQAFARKLYIQRGEKTD